jgi:hypothetical protein
MADSQFPRQGMGKISFEQGMYYPSWREGRLWSGKHHRLNLAGMSPPQFDQRKILVFTPRQVIVEMQ